MILFRRLRECQAGATLVEFALVAPVFVAMIFGIIEASRVFWIKQSLDEVAYSTVRCMSVNSACGDEDDQKAFAVDRAAGYGITLTPANVVPAEGSCKGNSDSYSITITKNIGSPLGGLVPKMPSSLSAVACYPKLA